MMTWYHCNETSVFHSAHYHWSVRFQSWILSGKRYGCFGNPYNWSILLKTSLAGGCILWCFIFFLFLFSPILSHHYLLWYFNNSDLDSWSQIKVITGGHIVYIIFQSHLLLLQYLHLLFIHLLNLDDGSFTRIFICCSLEDNITRLSLDLPFSE